MARMSKPEQAPAARICLSSYAPASPCPEVPATRVSNRKSPLHACSFRNCGSQPLAKIFPGSKDFLFFGLQNCKNPTDSDAAGNSLCNRARPQSSRKYLGNIAGLQATERPIGFERARIHPCRTACKRSAGFSPCGLIANHPATCAGSDERIFSANSFCSSSATSSAHRRFGIRMYFAGAR
jgi:hypothetical protein